MLSIGIKFSLFLDIKLYILEITEFIPLNSKTLEATLSNLLNTKITWVNYKAWL